MMTPEQLELLMKAWAADLVAEGVTDPVQLGRRLEEKRFLFERQLKAKIRLTTAHLNELAANQPVLDTEV